MIPDTNPLPCLYLGCAILSTFPLKYSTSWLCVVAAVALSPRCVHSHCLCFSLMQTDFINSVSTISPKNLVVKHMYKRDQKAEYLNAKMFIFILKGIVLFLYHLLYFYTVSDYNDVILARHLMLTNIKVIFFSSSKICFSRTWTIFSPVN